MRILIILELGFLGGKAVMLLLYEMIYTKKKIYLIAVENLIEKFGNKYQKKPKIV